MSDGLATRLDVDGNLPDTVDEAAIDRMKAVAWVMDESIGVPGTDITVGLDPLVSAVPVVGDIVSGGLSLYIVVESAYLGVSYTTLVRMLGNVGVDVAGGSLPWVGTVFDAFWKTNVRNVELLLDDLGVEDERGEEPEDESEAHPTDDSGPVTIEVEEPQQE